MTDRAWHREEVQMAPGVLAWSPQRGPITSPDELAAAVRDDEVVLRATGGCLVRAGDGDAPLVAMIRVDNDVAVLLRQLTDLTLKVEDLHSRLLDIADATTEILARR
jgi:hypothetical protein